MKLLFASAEIYPYAKTGGLADVAQALPTALYQDIDVTSIMPLYSFIDRDLHKIYPLNRSYDIIMGAVSYTITLFQGFNRGVKTLFVYEELLCNRRYPYGDAQGDYLDNHIRFGLFSKSLVVVAKDFEMDVLHLNDWHTALAALWAKELCPNLGVLFTIHNLAFQGIYSHSTISEIGIDNKYYTAEGIEFWGDINLLKAGVAYSNIVTTVSPRYAKEILEPDFGYGLDGFLKLHKDKLCGILNGIDTRLFNPLSDPYIIQEYSLYSFHKKIQNKKALCGELGLEDYKKPLFVFIGRFAKQKGLDIIIETLPLLLQMDINISILGEGDPSMASALIDISKEYDNLSVLFGYDESLSHRKYAAADFLLMPSSFEPCGLNQLISLRYGTIPIVHRVGGLYDSIIDIDDEEAICGRGIVMESLDSDGLTDAISRAVELYANPSRLADLATKNMSQELSFAKSADRYLDCYIDTIS